MIDEEVESRIYRYDKKQSRYDVMKPTEEELATEQSECQTKHDSVNHPKHYTSHPEGIECIQVTRHLSFNLGNAVKYIWRSPYKGNNIEDLRKSIWYINDEIKRLEEQGKMNV